jgi:hypothetical protein
MVRTIALLAALTVAGVGAFVLPPPSNSRATTALGAKSKSVPFLDAPKVSPW